jgi:hypothetical protein
MSLQQYNNFSLLINNQIISDATEICNNFNTFFCEIASHISFPGSDYESTIAQNYATDLNRNFFVIRETNSGEISQIIGDLKQNAASGYDQISTKFCNRTTLFITDKITEFVNQIIDTAHFPDVLKESKVIPIHKSGSKLSMNNYRPVSIQSVFCKIVDRVLLNRFNEYLEEHNLIDDRQYGFTPTSSTLAATASLTNFICEKMDAGFYVACLFLDLSKAFDCVDHKLFLSKCYREGVRNKSYDLFCSYFLNRTQRVWINDKKSDLRYIERGVIQGAIPSPTFFIFFINDVFNLKLKGTIQVYADDIAIKYNCNSVDELFVSMKHDLELIHEWLEKNMLKLNVSKTNYMIFETRRNLSLQPHHKLEFNGQLIERAYSVTYLGLHLDSHMRFDIHIDHLRKKITPILFALRRTRHLITHKAAMAVYYAHIYSRLTYLNPIWNGASLDHMKKLSVLQNKALKIINFKPMRYPTKLLYSPKIIPVSVICKFELGLLTFKLINGSTRNDFTYRRTHEIHEYGTRSRNNFYVQTARTEVGRDSIFFKGIAIFDGLPNEIREETVMSKFKTALKSHFFNIYNNS